ncbi:MAG: ArnT family glycosyltransferase [Candidatus Dormibacteria bacterium]
MTSWARPSPGYAPRRAATVRTAPGRRPGELIWPRLILLVLVAGAVFLHLQGLAHSFIAPWDEAVHAVVARRIMQHPLLPTLYDIDVFPAPSLLDWQHAHIWIHLPPLGLWASALSLKVLGLSPLALRLPGVGFCVVGMLATYEIGRRISGVACGLVAAVVAGYAPYALLVSQGYVFGDLTDTPLLALGPVIILLVLLYRPSGSTWWMVAAGAVQGGAVLAKGPFGLATAAVTVCLLSLPHGDFGDWRRRRRGLLCFAAATVVVALPYYLYVANAFPAVYAVESANWKLAFFHDYENWGRPWDFHFTEYLYSLYGSAPAILLVGGTILGAVMAIRQRKVADVVGVSWVLAVYLPLTFAVSKADPFALPALPALGLVVGRLVDRALAPGMGPARLLALALLLGAGLTATLHLLGVAPFVDVARDGQYDTFTPLHDHVRNTFEERMQPLRLALLVTGGVLLALYWAGLVGLRRVPLAPLGLLLAAMVLGVYWGRMDLQVAVRQPRAYDVAPVEGLGRLVADHTPSNATVILREGLLPMAHSDLMLMFWSGRDVYERPPLATGVLCGLARVSTERGSPLFYLTPDPGPLRSVGTLEGWSLRAVECPLATAG